MIIEGVNKLWLQVNIQSLLQNSCLLMICPQISAEPTRNETTTDHFVNANVRETLFDSNLCSTSHFNPEASTIPRHEVLLQPTEGSNVSDYGCITYSNVIFVPATRSTQDIEDIPDSVKDEKIEGYNAMEMLPYKYVVSSDQRIFNTFVRNGDGVENVVGGFDANFSEIMDNGDGIILNDQNQLNIYQNDDNVIQSDIQNEHHARAYLDVDYIPENQIRSDSEIILQCSNGQLYRQIQNVYVNQIDGSKSVELVPLQCENSFEMHSQYVYNNRIEPFTEQSHVDNEVVQTETVGMIFDEQHKNQGEFPLIDSLNQKETADNVTYQHQQQLQQKPKEDAIESHSTTKDHQRMLMETISPLCKCPC